MKHILTALLHSVNHNRCKWKGHVSDAKPDDLRFGIGSNKFICLSCNVCKKIIRD